MTIDEMIERQQERVAYIKIWLFKYKGDTRNYAEWDARLDEAKQALDGMKMAKETLAKERSC